MFGVDINTFNSKAEFIEPLINSNTKAIVPVHLYGQSCEMDGILSLAKKYNLKIIEENAQAIGCKYTFANGDIKYTGTIGDIATTSFYPSKNLTAFLNNLKIYIKKYSFFWYVITDSRRPPSQLDRSY